MIINPYIYGVATSYDPDAQLFFNAQTAAGVTLTTTQMNAVNQWVVDAKAANIWTKFKAIYPVVGGTATSHKFNLKNPLDTDAAFRLLFTGGFTHSSTGVLPNGVNAYASTFLIPTTSLSANSSHVSIYNRTVGSGTINDWGTSGGGLAFGAAISLGGTAYLDCYNSSTNRISTPNADARGFYISSRNSSTSLKLFKNAAQLGTTNVNASVGVAGLTADIKLFSYNPVQNLSNRECAFASLGDGLTDLESQLFYQITEKYQVALSRNINTTQSFYYNSAYNNETNAFLFSTQITDNTIQTATNTLVTDLKTAGVFTKMKALYPMVGGTATTCKFNLVNPQDTDAAFRLNFVGGWTPSATGMTPNGTNAYANTFLSSGNNLSLNSGHLSYYSRSNNVSAAIKIDMGSLKTTPDSYTDLVLGSSNLIYFRFNNGATYNSTPATNTLGYFIGSRTTAAVIKTFKDGVIVINGTAVSSSTSLTPFFIGASNNNGTAAYYSNNQCALSSIGDGLTDAEALATRTAVQNFQTTLGRQV
jgi:hypothetical protein